MKTLFKGNGAKANEITKLTNFIASAESDEDNYSILIKIVTIHLHKNVIPKFKKKKIASFVRALKQFSEKELGNATELK